MERLTRERVNGIKKGYWSPNKKDELVERLAAYENTGLTPEEIISLNEFENSNGQKLLLEIAKHKWIPVEKHLPKNPEELVLVQVSGRPCENIRFINAIELATYNCDGGWMLEHYPDWNDALPVAWMPLPELYQLEDKCHGCFGAANNDCEICNR